MFVSKLEFDFEVMNQVKSVRSAEKKVRCKENLFSTYSTLQNVSRKLNKPKQNWERSGSFNIYFCENLKCYRGKFSIAGKLGAMLCPNTVLKFF